MLLGVSGAVDTHNDSFFLSLFFSWLWFDVGGHGEEIVRVDSGNETVTDVLHHAST
jgi:hypothetical protein